MAIIDNTQNPMRFGHLKGPLSIIATGPGVLLLVQQSETNNPNAMAQVYDLHDEKLVEELKPIGIWLKFMYYVEEVVPARLWTPDEERRQIENYTEIQKARARAAAQAED
jgi:hypothetical protein